MGSAPFVDSRPQGKRAQRGTGGVMWRPTWVFKGEETEDRIRTLLEGERGPVLHACCGASRIGDVRLDLGGPAKNVLGDALAMPFREGTFGAVVIDPPYNVRGPIKARFVHECLRVTRAGGAFILHAPWFGALARLELEAQGLRLDDGGRHWPRAPVMLTKWRVLRTPGSRSARWRRPPDVRDAIRAHMRPGAQRRFPPPPVRQRECAPPCWWCRRSAQAAREVAAEQAQGTARPVVAPRRKPIGVEREPPHIDAGSWGQDIIRRVLKEAVA